MGKRKRTKRFYRSLFAGGMALALCTVVPSARGQQSPDQSQQAQQDQSQQRSQGDQQRDRDNPNPDLRRQQLAEMDRFLDKNPDVDAQLRKQPDLILNQTYLSQHPDLQAFINDHPQLKEEFRENPNYFMYRENRYDAATSGRSNFNNPDLRRQQLAEMDRFLDSHPDVDAQLRKQPDLILNQTYLSQHQDLQAFINDHPQLKEEFRENPNYFMYRENRYDAATSGRSNPSPRERTNPNPDLTRRELAEMDRFLDNHPDIDAQLRKQPDLILNQTYLSQHQDLQAFVNEHPELKEEFRENPNYFMYRENRYDARENERGNPNSDSRRQPLAQMDQFLDSHPETAQQLRKQPDLVLNDEFLKSHPDLREYLQQHPDVRDQMRKNPNAFMAQEAKFDQRGDNDANRDRDRDTDRRDAASSGQRGDNDTNRNRDRDTDRREVANFDQFLDSHHETAEQLRRNPSQINNDEFVKSHPALQAYLQQHPGVRQEVSQNPNAFMQQEARYDRNDNGMDRDSSSRRQFGEFLGGHSDVARQLSENPSLAKNHEYMDNHPELRDYLNSHPDVQKQLTADPDNFVKSAQQFNTTTTPGQTTKTPVPDATKPKQ